MQQFEFIDNRRVLRLVGILLLAMGLLAAYVIFSGTRRAAERGGPNIRLPKIGAQPPGGTPKEPLPILRDRQPTP